MAIALAFLLALVVAGCTWRYVALRHQSAEAFLDLQRAIRRKIGPARKRWDKAHERQQVFLLSGALAFIGLILAVFLPGVSSLVQLVPMGIGLIAAAVAGLTALRCAWREQNS